MDLTIVAVYMICDNLLISRRSKRCLAFEFQIMTDCFSWQASNLGAKSSYLVNREVFRGR